ncbi:DUF732 domain-containing protein [Mycolicibacterium flavescens]|uniref:DUF732 domain-containing protein n=1 Tax=Mycolicibacterium flavescens TaxID=1776 RepID=UPI000A0467D9|nr:DUF732 domain-containing protein [Mycolicibacterium flavescens]MCV7283032.1 DUF732 domain-containing protein [Mycolicibacterium flavescens]
MLSTLTAAVIAALTFAAPAAADEAEFLRKLQDQYVYLTPDQLLAAGHQVCAAARQGVPASESVMMVRDLLGTSVPAAGDIVSTAVVELGC